MRQKNLYLLVGAPGSGKSTWAKKFIDNTPHTIWVSRDEVRFSMVAETEDYFSHETEVFNNFIRYINEAIILADNIIVDATHMTEKSREKVLKQLTLNNVSLYAVVFDTPFNICVQRNDLRSGRLKVPKSAIKNLIRSFKDPALDKRKYTKIIHINEQGVIK